MAEKEIKEMILMNDNGLKLGNLYRRQRDDVQK